MTPTRARPGTSAPRTADHEERDRQLVTAYLASRSEPSFRELYRRHGPAMYGLALRLLGGRVADAEDVLQDAWMRALPRLQAFRWESTLRTWLCGFAVNCARERAREPWFGETIEPRIEPVARPAELHLESLVNQLPAGYRVVLVLHDIEGYTHREISSLLGIDDGTAKSQLSRARRTLRRWLEATSEYHDARTRRG